MNCRQARSALHDALNDDRATTSALAAHLAGCPACRRERDRLAALEGLLTAATACDPPPAVVERAASLAAAGRPSVAAPRRRAVLCHLAWAVVALAAFLAGFSVNKTETVERVVERPVVTQRVVEVPVPVIEERVVTREVRVPVVRTRVVYRDRPAAAASQAPPEAQEVPGPLPAPAVTTTLPAPEPPWEPGPTMFMVTTRPAALAEPTSEG